jgi:hypothetical protein
MKHIARNLLLGLGIFSLGSTLALADMGPTMSSAQQPVGTATQPGGQSAAAPMMPVQPTQNPHVGPTELRHFASAIVAIQPIDKKVHQEMSTKKLTMTQHRRLLAKYGKKIRRVLVQNHLTPVRYEMLLKKAQTDPMFARRTEAVMKSMG